MWFQNEVDANYNDDKQHIHRVCMILCSEIDEISVNEWEMVAYLEIEEKIKPSIRIHIST